MIILCFISIVAFLILVAFLSNLHQNDMSIVTLKNTSSQLQTIIYKGIENQISPNSEITMKIPKDSELDVIIHHTKNEEYYYIKINEVPTMKIYLTENGPQKNNNENFSIKITNTGSFPVIFMENDWTSDIILPENSVIYNTKIKNSKKWKVIHPTNEIKPIYEGIIDNKHDIIFDGSVLK